MFYYIVKTFDDRGRLVARFEFAAPDDAEALGAAAELQDGRSQELWCGRRWVSSWPAVEGRRLPG